MYTTYVGFYYEKKMSLFDYRNLFNHFLQLWFWTKILMCKYINMSKVDCEKNILEYFVQKVVPQLQINPCAKVVWHKSPYIIWYLQTKVSINGVIFFCTFTNWNVSHVKCFFLILKKDSFVWFLYNLVWYKSGIGWNQKFYIKWGTFKYQQDFAMFNFFL